MFEIAVLAFNVYNESIELPSISAYLLLTAFRISAFSATLSWKCAHKLCNNNAHLSVQSLINIHCFVK